MERHHDRGRAGADRQGDAPPPQRALPDRRRRSPRCMPRATTPEETDWTQIDLLYGALEVGAALAGGDAQPRGRGLEGARAAGRARSDRAAGAEARQAISTSPASSAAPS